MNRREFVTSTALVSGATVVVNASLTADHSQPPGHVQPPPASFGEAGRDFPKVGGNLPIKTMSAWHINLEGGDTTTQNQECTIVAQNGIRCPDHPAKRFRSRRQVRRDQMENKDWRTSHKYARVAVAEGMVFSTSGDNFVYALDRETGRTVWKTELLTEEEEGSNIVNERDGDPLFKGLKGASLAGAIVYWDGLIYVGAILATS